jgi:hypothetical protein
LQNGELQNLCSSQDNIRQKNQGEWVGRGMWHAREKGRNVYRVLVGKPEGKHHSEDQGVEGRMVPNGPSGDWVGGVVWIHLAQGREHWWAVVSAVMNLLVLAPRVWLVISMSICKA